MKTFVAIVFFIVFVVVLGFWRTSNHLGWVKDRAEQTFSANGFNVVGYQGYNLGAFIPGGVSNYGGPCVWYTLERNDRPGVTYEACIQRWGEEVHIYNAKAFDAIKAGAK